MPLVEGSGRKAISKNIAIEIRAGKSRAQAEAIAYSEAGEDEAYIPGERKPTQGMRFYTTQQLGKSQSVTPEGFLLCKDVPIARTGELVYGPNEVPLEGGRDGLIRVKREDDQVFRPETLASFEGKPVTNDHPDMGVSPENFREHVVGVTQNVRRGTGIESDLILADLLIQHKEAIDAVRDGKREVSCGYDADYEQTEPGRGRQVNIVGNHVALVEQGRCGPRCAIQDRSIDMTKKASWLDRLRAAVTLDDKKAIADALKDAEAATVPGAEGGTQVHVHVNDKRAKDESEEEEEEGKGGESKDKKSMDARMKAIEDTLSKLVKDKKAKDDEAEGEEGEEETMDEDKEDEDKEKGKGKDKKTGDSADRAVMQDLASRAELLSPGFKVPTFDAANGKKFKDFVCGCKRKALQAALTGDTKDVVAPLLEGTDLKAIQASTVDALFTGASELIRVSNNSGGVRVSVSTKDFGKAVTPASLNQAAKKFWSDRKQA